MLEQSVIVIGGGIAGLTAGALLAHEGINVTLLEAHNQVGGCAGTFRRGPYIFDVGATQVAGFERGGIHERIFRHLQWPLPSADVLDPACVVHLGDGKRPIHLWHDPSKWQEERKDQFPGSELFWYLCSQLHQSNWSFACNDPILPIQNYWDLKQFVKATRPMNVLSGFFSRSSVTDLLWLCACNQDKRLKAFLDLQLKLYSQELSDETAALYGATVLQMAQAPLGLYHLHGSMQKLSDHLLACFLRDGGNLLLGHKVVEIVKKNENSGWKLKVINKQLSLNFQASDLIFTLPPQSLLDLVVGLPLKYRHRLENLSQPSGAIVFYGAIKRCHLPLNIAGHIQVMSDKQGSLFISISQEGDGRAPVGEATVIASAFTDVSPWMSCNEVEYRIQKKLALTNITEVLNTELNIEHENWQHKELATPKSFAKWTGRPQGIVGGLGQKPTIFGPFGLSSRTPMNGLWLCGDSIYPGEGTAGVSQSSVMACKQFMSEKGLELNLSR
ncbi:MULTISPECIES: C-3',4' desaturase CrtD [Prochlorococcus]|uniref:Phytoene dehydrogenase/carotenoid isomerase n=1 Tax=Prochlorococcus marinus (strain SARG / CCMP1375 / SS120) TaxID=167539 RepID=Q7V9V4_PROMA|nr:MULTISPECIES: C-3',4' desaturase CrtD [Prochlorococcus]AAQ00764.1 Phytoene dehydrogenase/carotenoid isomerase [Prochlorococcus marinus subsp. marinus str. CCMP1375]KGG21163.1 Neurosporene desaturase [Prochlorococcus marinus str. SS2]KGG23987.1 Neurosporene desaturase [Prochlorococcus marinus str. SS35]